MRDPFSSSGYTRIHAETVESCSAPIERLCPLLGVVSSQVDKPVSGIKSGPMSTLLSNLVWGNGHLWQDIAKGGKDAFIPVSGDPVMRHARWCRHHICKQDRDLHWIVDENRAERTALAFNHSRSLYFDLFVVWCMIVVAGHRSNKIHCQIQHIQESGISQVRWNNLRIYPCNRRTDASKKRNFSEDIQQFSTLIFKDIVDKDNAGGSVQHRVFSKYDRPESPRQKLIRIGIFLAPLFFKGFMR